MPNVIISPNMNLPVPVVGVDSGPDWANNINSCLSLIDSHNHASGSGVQITPNGLNINADLAINGNNLTLIRTSRYQVQSALIPASSPDIGCTYVSGVDLYYNDGSGNQVRITQSGGVAGSPGSISNLTAPASAAYVSGTQTFVWQSNANVAANMDARSYIYRNSSVSSFGLTLSAPSLSSDYTITLPTLPGTQKFLTLDNTGNMAASWSVDNSTLAISGSNVIVKSAGITSTQLAAQAVQQSNIYIKTTSTNATAGNMAVSNSSGNYSNATNTPSTIVSMTLATTGRPVQLSFVSINGTSTTSPPNSFGAINSPFGNGLLYLFRNASQIQVVALGSSGSGIGMTLPSVVFYDFPSAGTQSYELRGSLNPGATGTLQVNNMILIASEMN